MPASTRDRILEAAAELFRRHGYTGTGLKQISAESRAPLGSLYHFFPGGKEQLTAETLRWSGAGYQMLVEAVFDGAPDLVPGIRGCFAAAADVLVLSDFADACPIETVALEVASTNETLRRVTADIFESWIESAASRGERAGLPADAARRLGITFVSALEGAFILARATKSTEPMYVAAESVVVAVQAALDAIQSADDRGVEPFGE
ncbi:MAG: hypothetical protein QOK28_2695 [Actinomycetota bacterium]|jgi:AcrR family transcriptional regulator